MAKVKYVGQFAEGVVYDYPQYVWKRGETIEGVPDVIALALKKRLPKDFLIYKDKKNKLR